MWSLPHRQFSTVITADPTVKQAADGAYVPVIKFPGEPISAETQLELQQLATHNITTILSNSLRLSPNERLVVVYDRRHLLTSILTDAYQHFAT
jgi:hypothetical protein